MSLLEDFKIRFANDTALDLVAIEANWVAFDPVYSCYYGCEYGLNSCSDEAIFQLIAHLSLAENGTGTSPNKSIASKSVGSVSVSYTPSDNASEFNLFFKTSKYGQRFLQLIQHNRGGYFV